MEEKNSVTARIFGNEYTIVGTESKEYIKKVCETVDEKMNFIAQIPALNPMRTAVLCSVNICDEMLKCEEKLKQTRLELEKLEEECKRLKIQNKILTEENIYLKDEIRTKAVPDMRVESKFKNGRMTEKETFSESEQRNKSMARDGKNKK